MTPTQRQDWRSLNDAMIERLKSTGLLSDPRVESALRTVPRHEFVLAESDIEDAYEGSVIRVLASADGGTLSTISDVRSVTGLLQELNLQSGERALEIGLGTGYNAALMAHLVAPGGVVTSLDYEEALVRVATESLQRLGIENVRTFVRDGWLGDHDSTFDAILATVGVADLSPHWANQLRDGGRLIVPLWISSAVRPGVSLEKRGARFVGRTIGAQHYIMLKGRGHDDLGDWVLIDDDYWTLRSGSSAAWQVLIRLLAEGPVLESHLDFDHDVWPWWRIWIGLEDPNVFVTGRGLFGLFDQEASGLVVVDERERVARAYGDRKTYDRLVERFVERRSEAAKTLSRRALSELLVEAVPAGEGVDHPDAWLFRRENYDFMLRLPGPN